jgi:hypothetical protein
LVLYMMSKPDRTSTVPTRVEITAFDSLENMIFFLSWQTPRPKRLELCVFYNIKIKKM